MLGMTSFVTIDRSVHELFSEKPRSPKTRKSVAIHEAVSDHSAPVLSARQTAAPRAGGGPWSCAVCWREAEGRRTLLGREGEEVGGVVGGGRGEAGGERSPI